MKPAIFSTPAQREAYDHGRDQAKLETTRNALTEILEIATARSRRPGALHAIAVRAEWALKYSKPDPETNFMPYKRPLYDS